MDEPQEVWRGQEGEEIKVSTEYFKMQAERRRTRQRWMAVGSDAVGVLVLGFLAYLFGVTPKPVSRVGLVLAAAGWIFGVWLRRRRGTSGGAPIPGLQAYIVELERARDEARDMLKVLALLLPNPKVLVRALPFCIVLAVWLALVFPVRRRRMRELQREIDILKQS